MLHSSISASTAGGIPAVTETIQSRFGDIVIDTSKALVFPRGLLGMADKSRFALSNFPSEKMQQFTLLQSLEDKTLSFITLPLQIENPIIAANDIREASQGLQIAEPNLAILLVVSVHRRPTEVKLSVNARAPLFIDSANKLGVQYVFQNDAYKVQHML
jgi:flagellar assembly factor FliW